MEFRASFRNAETSQARLILGDGEKTHGPCFFQRPRLGTSSVVEEA